MNKRNILAHRGLWKDESDKNSLDSLVAALRLGFGIETDVRDFCGSLVVSHDPALGSSPSLRELLSEYHRSPFSSTMALNIKSDGLAPMLHDALRSSNITAADFFVFDMSVPDMKGYFELEFPVYSRVSEFEDHRRYFNTCAGTWVDNFSGQFEQVEIAKDLLNDGESVAFVSPELHGRGHLDVWSSLLRSGVSQNENFYLCTDFPLEAVSFFEVL